MGGKQHKREIKARKRAAREAARRAERRRNLMTAIVVVAVVVIGAVLIVLSIERTGTDLAEATEAPTDPATDGEGTESPLEGPGAVVPEDPGMAPGEPVDSGLEPAVDDRPVACGADEPEDVDETRPRFPGGPARVVEEGVDYTATIETSCGTVVIDLLEDEAPEAVNSFAFLASRGFFDGREIFRNATSIGALQTGSGDNSNTWSIGYRLPDELGLAESEGYPVGSVAMANSGPDSAGSQFFFVYTDAFDAAFEAQRAYTVFAQVTEGLDVLEEIGGIPTTDGGETPTERVYLESVTISPAPGPGAAETSTAGPAETSTAGTEPAQPATESPTEPPTEPPTEEGSQ